jgi:hypothetical protein
MKNILTNSGRWTLILFVMAKDGGDNCGERKVMSIGKKG